MDDPRTALLVVAPETEAAVGSHRAALDRAALDRAALDRAALDRAAQLNVPAHVTVLFSFLPPTGIDLDELPAQVDGVPGFEVRFAR
jgi:hypothetical protein